MKKELYAAYTEACEKSLIKKIMTVENEADKCKCQENWMITNEITGRKRGNSSQIQGTGSEDKKRK